MVGHPVNFSARVRSFVSVVGSYDLRATAYIINVITRSTKRAVMLMIQREPRIIRRHIKLNGRDASSPRRQIDANYSEATRRGPDARTHVHYSERRVAARFRIAEGKCDAIVCEGCNGIPASPWRPVGRPAGRSIEDRTVIENERGRGWQKSFAMSRARRDAARCVCCPSGLMTNNGHDRQSRSRCTQKRGTVSVDS